jgi:hypothetical protein
MRSVSEFWCAAPEGDAPDMLVGRPEGGPEKQRQRLALWCGIEIPCEHLRELGLTLLVHGCTSFPFRCGTSPPVRWSMSMVYNLENPRQCSFDPKLPVPSSTLGLPLHQVQTSQSTGKGPQDHGLPMRINLMKSFMTSWITLEAESECPQPSQRSKIGKGSSSLKRY